MEPTRAAITAGAVAGLVLATPGLGVIPTAVGVESAGGASAASRIYPVDREPFGRTYASVTADYMQWVQEIPVRRNPALNPDSTRNCETHGNFVYMGARGTGNGCVIPAGKAIVLSFAGFECSTAEGLGRTFPQLRRCARATYIRVFNRFVFKFVLRIDGQKVERPRRWTVTTDNRIVDFPRRNLWGAPPGRTKSVTRGLFYIVKPMRPGRHVITARGTDWEFGRFEWVYRFRVRR